MNEILLSIIIPCYNSYRYISECFSRFENVKNANVEIIIIDDYSNDGTYERLCTLKGLSKICNFVLEKNENEKGPGGARNTGLKFATGKYVTFMDSDDYFTDEFYDIILPALNCNADCFVFDYYYVESNKRKASSVFFKEQKDGWITTNEALVFLKGSTWGKVYKKTVIDNCNVKFLNQMRNEDMPFTKVAISNCKTIRYIKKPLYSYIQQPGSLMHNKKLLDAQNAINSFNYVEKEINEQFEDEKEALFILELLYSTGMTNSILMNRKNWNDYINSTEIKYKDYLNNKYFGDYSRKVKFVIFLIHFRLYWILHFVVGLKE